MNLWCARREKKRARGQSVVLTDIDRSLHWSTRRAPDADTLFSGSEMRGELVDTAATPLRKKVRRDVVERDAPDFREDGFTGSGKENAQRVVGGDTAQAVWRANTRSEFLSRDRSSGRRKTRERRFR
jgi:hypothetical protein